MRPFLRGAALVAVALLAGGCMPGGATTQAKSISGLYQLFFAAATVVFVIVAGLITWSIFRYRHRGGEPPRDRDLPPQYHSNLILEAIWTTLPILTVIGLFAATLGTLSFVQARSPDELQVHVTGYQWSWRFDYTGSNVSVVGTTGHSPEMVVPVGRTVHVTLTAADVNHSFFVPAFLFKQDAIPGHPNQFDFKVDQAGTYRGQCAEFCGVYHFEMTFTIRAVPEAEFTSWLRQQQAAGSSGSPAGSGSAAPSGSAVPASPSSPAASPSPSASAS